MTTVTTTGAIRGSFGTMGIERADKGAKAERNARRIKTTKAKPRMLLVDTTFPRRNTNFDVPGLYSCTYFRIKGVPGTTFDESGRKISSIEVSLSFEKEVREILESQGWTILESEMDGTAPRAIKGKSNLYLHPANFSGVCENAERESLFEVLKTASTFSCDIVNAYEEVHDMTDEQLMSHLQTIRLTVENDLLQALTTKRRSAYFSHTGVAGIVASIASGYKIKRLAIEGRRSHGGKDDTSPEIVNAFVSSVLTELINHGRVKASLTKNGSVYRTARHEELPFAGRNQQVGCNRTLGNLALS